MQVGTRYHAQRPLNSYSLRCARGRVPRCRSGEERWSSSLHEGLPKRRGAAPWPARPAGPARAAPRAPPGVPAAAAAAEMARGGLTREARSRSKIKRGPSARRRRAAAPNAHTGRREYIDAPPAPKTPHPKTIPTHAERRSSSRRSRARPSRSTSRRVTRSTT